MADTKTRELDWSTARIEDGALAVSLTGKASKDWSRHFKHVVALLRRSHGDWGEITLGKHGVEVAAVSEGSEARLRHFLESVTLEVNAELDPHGDYREHRLGQDDAHEETADERMAATFRGFAQHGDGSP